MAKLLESFNIKDMPEYPFLLIKFGGWHWCKSLDEAKEAQKTFLVPTDLGVIYKRGFYSRDLQREIAQNDFFPVYCSVCHIGQYANCDCDA